MKRLHSMANRLANLWEVVSQDWNRPLFVKAVTKLVVETIVATYGSRAIRRRHAGAGGVPPRARLGITLLWVVPALRLIVVALSVTERPRSAGRGTSDGTFLFDYQQRTRPYELKSGPPLGYRLIDVIWYELLSRPGAEAEAAARALTREPWESDIALRYEPILHQAVADVRSSLPDVPDFDYGLANRLGFGATAHTLADGRRTVTITAITPLVLVRALKYYVVFMQPGQRVYYSAANLLLPTLTPQQRLLAEDLEQLFSSVADGGPPTSRLIRLNVTGVMLQSYLLQRSLQFMLLHECAHMLERATQQRPGIEAEIRADAWALGKLLELDSGEDQAVASAYDEIMRDASSANRRRLALPSLGAAPLPVQAAAHALAINALCSSDPTQLHLARSRIISMVDSACPGFGDALRDDLTDQSALLGFLLGQRWSSSLEVSSLALLLQRFRDEVASS